MKIIPSTKGEKRRALALDDRYSSKAPRRSRGQLAGEAPHPESPSVPTNSLKTISSDPFHSQPVSGLMVVGNPFGVVLRDLVPLEEALSSDLRTRLIQTLGDLWATRRLEAANLQALSDAVTIREQLMGEMIGELEDKLGVAPLPSKGLSDARGVDSDTDRASSEAEYSASGKNVISKTDAVGVESEDYIEINSPEDGGVDDNSREVGGSKQMELNPQNSEEAVGSMSEGVGSPLV